jgi:hypothetical protein
MNKVIMNDHPHTWEEIVKSIENQYLISFNQQLGII